MSGASRSAAPALIQNLTNAALFQVVWIACVAGGASGLWWIGPFAVLAFAFWEIPRSADPRGELALAATAALLGLVIDSIYLQAGLLTYPAHGPLQSLAPVWIIALWVGLALTLNHSLAWLHGRPVVAAIAGGLSGSFSFWIGARVWGAADFVAPPAVVLVVLAAVWSMVMPILMTVARRLSAAANHPNLPPLPTLAVESSATGGQQ